MRTSNEALIYLTAYPDELEDLAREGRLPGEALLAKPISSEDLFSVVEQMTGEGPSVVDGP